MQDSCSQCSKNTKSASKKKESSLTIKPKRWGKNEDVEMYRILLRLERETKISIEDLLAINPKSARLDQNPLLQLVAQELRWRRPLPKLLKRIQKICAPSNFSVRELHSFKRKIKEQHTNGDIDYDELMVEFPGKSLLQIKDAASDYLEQTGKTHK